MRNFLLCLLLLLVLPGTGAKAQHLRLRNLYRHMADTATTDSIRIKAYTKLTEEYLDSSYSIAMHYARFSDSLADQYVTWAPGKVLTLTAMGYVYQAIDLPDTALYYFHLARTLALRVPNKTYIKKCTFALYRFYNGRSEDSALYYVKEQLMYARQLRDTTLEMATIDELGGFYLDRGDYRQAIAWWRHAIPVLYDLKQYHREATVLMNIGKTYLGIGQLDSARHYLFTARTSARRMPFFTEQAEAELALFDYYQKTNRPDAAQAAAETALKLASGQEDMPLLRDTWGKLTAIYEQTGQPALALNAHKLYIIYRDSVAHEERNLDDAKKILRAGYVQQLAVVERAQDALKITGRQQRRLLLAAAIGLLLLSTLVIVYYAALVKNKKRESTIAAQAALLREQKAAIQTTLAEKEVLMHEIHHRVKNNLQVISALQQMQAARSADPAVKAALEDSQNRVLSIALIHQNLYQHDDLEGVEVRSFVQELTEHVLNVCTHPETHIRIEHQIAPTTLDIDTAVPLGLIINELLTNSFKHAFKGRREGHIAIRLNQIIPGHYKLEYEDDGPGPDPSVDMSKADSLGLKLINQLADQLDGDFRYWHDAVSRFILSFKDFNTRNTD